ncbi:MAG: HAMP domain-containing histidine kinase [Firmicutes bacterium]|nr:HAMP domain-containing histidine kinase [Bacillota bacterium]
MKNKLLPAIIICIIAVSITIAVILGTIKPPSISTVELNEIKTEVEKNKLDYSKINDSGFNIIVINTSGTLKYPSASHIDATNYDEWLNYAYQNDCIILDFSEGKIFVFKPQDNSRTVMVIVPLLFATALSCLLIWYWLYIRKAIFKPFKRLQKFAGEVAAGNLDSPLLMDKKNAFGAFSESFDILREELKKSKENEIRLEKSKKELVAQVSHDIKTPIASIKAVAELIAISEKDEKKQKNIETIRRKATEIDHLVTDMFNVSLQDLSELKFKIEPVLSTDIERIINESDYLQKITKAKILTNFSRSDTASPSSLKSASSSSKSTSRFADKSLIVKKFSLPECLVEADITRLKQITDNIINNSYKYADTKISVSGEIIDNMLGIEFCDYGKGVPENELPLITNKFYRGKNVDNKTGAGLGLYICKTMLERMAGAMEYYNTKDGFAVKIFLKLA